MPFEELDHVRRAPLAFVGAERQPPLLQLPTLRAAPLVDLRTGCHPPDVLDIAPLTGSSWTRQGSGKLARIGGNLPPTASLDQRRGVSGRRAFCIGCHQVPAEEPAQAEHRSRRSAGIKTKSIDLALDVVRHIPNIAASEWMDETVQDAVNHERHRISQACSE